MGVVGVWVMIWRLWDLLLEMGLVLCKGKCELGVTLTLLELSWDSGT